MTTETLPTIADDTEARELIGAYERADWAHRMAKLRAAEAESAAKAAEYRAAKALAALGRDLVVADVLYQACPDGTRLYCVALDFPAARPGAVQPRNRDAADSFADDLLVAMASDWDAD